MIEGVKVYVWNRKKSDPHPCKSSRCEKETTNPLWCSEACRLRYHNAKQRKKKAEQRARIKLTKPDRYCSSSGCKEVLGPRRKKYCSIECSKKVRRDLEQYLKAERKKNKKRMKEVSL